MNTMGSNNDKLYVIWKHHHEMTMYDKELLLCFRIVSSQG
jgi:hypothetical protein